MTLIPGEKEKVVAPQEPEAKQAGTDLFVFLDAIWNKRKPEGTFPVFVAHRFLASDRMLAPACRELWRDLREPDLIFATWQALLPEGNRAPRLAYAAPKKGPEAVALTQRMMAVLGERRLVVEDMQAAVALAGRELDLYREFGIDPPERLLAAELDERAVHGAKRIKGKGKGKGKAEDAPDGLLKGLVP